MKRIGLIDLDYNGRFPNIALMKISAYHKSVGNLVEWYNGFMEEPYDIVFIAKVFSWTPDYPYYINAYEIIKGGSGYFIKCDNSHETYEKPENGAVFPAVTENVAICDCLPKEIEHMYPDYSIYPAQLTKDTAYGFLTRGCPRGCSFCHVSTKEGKRSRKVANLSEFWRGQKNIVLCDPNILACRSWRDLLHQLIKSKAYVDFNQGLDARMMTPEKAHMLGKIRIREIHFAWDRYEDKERVLKGLRIYQRYAEKKPSMHSLIVYVLVNFDTTHEQDLERIYTLRDMGYWAYVMIYDKENCDQWYIDLQRWCNNRYVFARVPNFDDYMKDVEDGSIWTKNLFD